MLIVGQCLTIVHAKITMPGGKTLLVFILAASVQGSVGEPIPKVEDSLGEPFISLLNGMGFGASLAQALRAQCECGACDEADPPGWLALVLRYGFASCGGALITDRHVLTSAHCVRGLEAPQVAVLLGVVGPRSQPLRDKPEAQPGEQLRLALHIARKSKMAVITLDAPITFSKTLAPICLPAPASKALKAEHVEVNGMALADSRTLALSALNQPGRVARVDGRDISFAPNDGVCLAFGGWPLVRRNETSSRCELIGIQAEVTITKSTTTETTPEKSPENSSEETTITTPTTTPGPECDGPSEFASVAHYVTWIHEETRDATQCAPPNAASEEPSQRKRWRGNLRSAARAAKRRASEQAKLKAAKKAAEKKASKKTREKRDIINDPKIDMARERVKNARELGENRAHQKLLDLGRFRQRSKRSFPEATYPSSLAGDRAGGRRLKARTMAAKKSALARKKIASRKSVVSSATTHAEQSVAGMSRLGMFPGSDVRLATSGKASAAKETDSSMDLLFNAKVWQ